MRFVRRVRPPVIIGMATAGLVVFAVNGGCRPSLKPYEPLMIPDAGVSVPHGAVKAVFGGVSTILLDDGDTAVMTDGFFTRPRTFSVLFRSIGPNTKRIGESLDRMIDRQARSRLRAVLVAHAHYDHAVDSRAVARLTGAELVGSQSVANIVNGERDSVRVRVVHNGDTFSYGRFNVKVISSPHTADAFFPGAILAPLETPKRVWRYREGGSFSYLIQHDSLRILIHPGTNFWPGQYAGVHADVVFLGIALLGRQSERFRNDYWREVVRATGARLVIPIHWDDLTGPIGESFDPMPNLFDDFDTGIKWVLQLAEADTVRVRLMRPFQAVDLETVLKDPRLLP